MSEEERIEARLKKIVDNVPTGEDGWWKLRGPEYFMDLGREMLRLGAGLTEIEYHMRRIYIAVADEFGG